MSRDERDVILTLSVAIWPSVSQWFLENKIVFHEECPAPRDDGWRRIGFSGVAVGWLGGEMLQLTIRGRGECSGSVLPESWFMINAQHYAGYSETKRSGAGRDPYIPSASPAAPELTACEEAWSWRVQR